MKNVIIVRGVSGSGKTSISNLFKDSEVVCADDFFTRQDGSYHFDPALIGRAHLNCRFRFDKALEKGVPNIIVSNTNTKKSDWEYYELGGKKHGYNIFFLVIENRHGNKDVHSVPDHVLNRQEESIRQTLKLR